MASADQSATKWKLKINKENDGREITFPKPNEIGCYSIDGTTKTFHDNNHLLRTIFIPSSGWNAKLSADYLNWDLNETCSQAIKFDFENIKHDTYILEWILHHHDEIQHVFKTPTSNDVKIDFVCNRNVLKKMCLTLGTAHEKSDWSFYACKFKSTIHMCSFGTPQPTDEKDKNREYWGDAFEKYMTIRNKDEKITPVNKNEGFYTMLKGQLNEYTLLYSAEVDGEDPKIPQSHLDSNHFLKSTDCYIELKLGNERLEQAYFYSRKLVYWFLQAVLGGIPKIICGIRNEDGFVKELKTYHVKMEKESATKGKRELEKKDESHNVKRQKTGKLEWRQMEAKDEEKIIYLDDTKEACLKICAQVLYFVKKCVQEDKRGTVYRFWHEDKANDINCEKLNDPVKYERILPKWYTDNQ